jgi:hypothetical protein
MSHLTSSPPQFSKPPPSRAYQVQRPQQQHPISPPETEPDMLGPSLYSATATFIPDHSPVQSLPHPAPIETPTERFRRVSALAYNARRSDNRISPKPARWLIVVIPPPTLSSDPTLLPALSSGPLARFSSGTLIPLYPTVCFFTSDMHCDLYSSSRITSKALRPAARNRQRV